MSAPSIERIRSLFEAYATLHPSARRDLYAAVDELQRRRLESSESAALRQRVEDLEVAIREALPWVTKTDAREKCRALLSPTPAEKTESLPYVAPTPVPLPPEQWTTRCANGHDLFTGTKEQASKWLKRACIYEGCELGEMSHAEREAEEVANAMYPRPRPPLCPACERTPADCTCPVEVAS